jgi:hypothetical protein
MYGLVRVVVLNLNQPAETDVEMRNEQGEPDVEMPNQQGEPDVEMQELGAAVTGQIQ